MVYKKNALKQLKSVINSIESLKKVEAFSGEHVKWLAIATDLLENIFGKGSRYFKTLISLTWKRNGQFIISDRMGSMNPQMAIDREHHKAYLKQLDSAKGLLEAAYTTIENMKDINSLNKKMDQKIGTISDNKQVFIVHGHNIEKKETTARIIEKLGLEPIILHEQANKGRTILEKLSECSDGVIFAIILLTADDMGKDKDRSDLIPRARQNVILELGYFLAKLGKKYVCAIYEDGVEIPTDYLGVTYIPFDSAGKWKFDLVKELKAVGFNVSSDDI